MAFDAEYLNRHDLEVKLVTGLKDRKEKELKQLIADSEQIKKDFLAMKDYQNALAETADLRQKIEEAKVQI